MKLGVGGPGVKKMRRRRAVKLGVEGAGSEENEAEEGSEAGGRGGRE